MNLSFYSNLLCICLFSVTVPSGLSTQEGKKTIQVGKPPARKSMDTNVEMVQKEAKTTETCDTCGKTFTSQFAFSRHVNSCKTKNLECSGCKAKFDDMQELKTHIGKVHKGKLFVCEEDENCYFTFSTKKGLLYHEATHKRITCEACDEIFDNSDDLSTHKKSRQHKQNATKSNCVGCRRQFTSRHKAQRHFESTCPHNPNRVVKCTVCKEKVGKAKDFLTHLKTVHNFKTNYMCTRCLCDVSTSKKLDAHLEKCHV